MRFIKLLQIFAAAGVLLGLVHTVIWQFTTPENHFHKFIYERGPFQHITLFAACVVVVLLLRRSNQFRRNCSQFKALFEGRGQPPLELARQLDVVAKICAEHGMRAAASGADQVAQAHAEEIHKAHETITHITGSLPVVGFLGTLLGLNQGLFVAFCGGSPKTESVMMFVTAFATTLDNTILAVFCAVPLFAAGFVLARLENELSSQYAAHVRKQFGLKNLPEEDKATPVLQAELRKITAKIAVEAKAAFERLLEESAGAYRDTLERAVQEVFAAQRRHDESMVKKVTAEVADRLGQSVHRVGDLLERQNGRLAEDMIRQVGQLENTLRNCTPEEVVIRYQTNGHAN
jgi:biopolymer transport protein ExbB/TolQ